MQMLWQEARRVFSIFPEQLFSLPLTFVGHRGEGRGCRGGRTEGVVTTRVTLWPAGALSWGPPYSLCAMGWLSLIRHLFQLLLNASGWDSGWLYVFQMLQVLTEP